MPFVRPEIAALQGYVPGEQPQTGKFIKLNTNENPYPCSPKVVAAIERTARAGLARYPDPMANAFRIAAADLLGLPGKDWILCGNGSDDILTILTRAFVGAGDLLRLPYPSYILYRTLAQLQGARWQETPFDENFQPSPAFFEPSPDLKLVYLPNPNSPTGTIVPNETLRKLADALPCPLVVDEAYVDFAEANAVELVKESDKVIVARTLSKSYALAGLRFGFVVAQPHIVEELAKVKDSYNCDALSIAGATAAILDQTWLVENRAKVVATRTKLVAGLTGLGFQTIPSQANFVWCEHPAHDSRALYEALKARRILVRYMVYPQWRSGLRISVGDEGQNEAVLGALKELTT